MDMAAAQDLLAGDLLVVGHELQVATARGHLLVRPAGERVGTGGGDPAAAGPRPGGELPAHVGEVGSQLVQRAADGGADLDLGQVQLVLDGQLPELWLAAG